MDLDFGNLFTTETIDTPDTKITDKQKYLKVERDKLIISRYKDVYIKYQENIKISEKLRCEINKGINTNEDTIELLKKALQCIGLMIGDNDFHKKYKG